MYEDKPDLSTFLVHYGKGHLDGGHSGRFPWGSGEDPYQGATEWMTEVNKLRKSNFKYTDPETGQKLTGDTAIAKYYHLSTTEFRTAYSLAKNEERTKKYNRAMALRESGMGYSEIARKMGLPKESSARSLLDGNSKMRMGQARETAEFLKNRLEEVGKDGKTMLQVGSGVERELGITRTKLDEALYILQGEGYQVLGGRVPNPTDLSGAHQTTIKVIASKDAKSNAIYDYGKIGSVKDYISRDNGKTFEKKFTYPSSMDSSRLKIRYAEDGGKEKDGTIEIRRGVEDLSLGESTYSQVRILVDNDRYLKGMAFYSDGSDMPDGVDVIFNTNKSKDVPMRDVLKKIKNDPDNPFGSAIKDADQGGQYWYIDSKTGKKKLGLINKRATEGDWSEWKDKVPAQFLSKQPYSLAKKQIDLAIQQKNDEYNDIMKLTNDTVKKNLLYAFAEDCDSTAVHLQAAALPRQKYQVILPSNSLSENKIYAPNYEDGEYVALVRYPHGGTFEIPILKVDNKNSEVKKMFTDQDGTLKNPKDAVVINSKVAERLSGADFDGDTVMVIPTLKQKEGETKSSKNGIYIASRPPLQDMEGFDMEALYGTTEELSKDSIVYKKAVEMRKNGYTDAEIAKEIGSNYKANDIDSLIKNGEKCFYNSHGKKIKTMTDTQMQMGKISNLITDMTIGGAPDDEMARAVKHSMVVIDAEKHHYDYLSSEKENGIAALKTKWQGKANAGAATLISKAKSPYKVPKRQGQPKINIKGADWYDSNRPEGVLIYKTSDNATYQQIKNPETKKWVDVYERADGSYIYNRSTDSSVKDYVVVEDPSKIVTKNRTTDSTRMAETDDAYTLVSKLNSPIENLYANYANTMKSLANQARKEYATTSDIKRDPSAAKTYAAEVQSLKEKLIVSEKNAPREKQAFLIANARISAKKESNPEIKSNKKELLKLGQQELSRAREEVGAKRTTIDITDSEWEAIQAGAIGSTVLKKILDHTDTDAIKEKATPRPNNGELPAVKVNRIKQLASMGYTNAQIAKAVGVSATTVIKYI